MMENGWSGTHIAEMLESKLPKPRLAFDGYFGDIPIMERTISNYQMLQELGWPVDLIDLLCVWYWSEAHWMLYVHEYQALPEVLEAYYLVYEPETDTASFVPASMRPQRRSPLRPTFVQPSSNYEVGRMKA